MKFILTPIKVLSILISILFLSSCGDDDTSPMNPDSGEPDIVIPVTQVATKSYPISTVNNPDVSGTAKLVLFSNDSTVMELKLGNTTTGIMHPAHVHFNTAAEGGDIAITLNAVDGNSGSSETTLTTLDDGSAITYAQFLEFDGYINIHQSADDLGTLVGQSDIGQNELTGESKEYILGAKDVATIDGTVTFYERANGEALAVIMLNETPADGIHPGHIHENSAAEGGSILFTFNPVNGDTGISQTNFAALDDETAFGYSDVLTVNGYINIHLSVAELNTIVAQGNIGANEGVVAEASKDFVVTSSGSSAYIFNSNDVTDLENPDLILKRGETYTFAVNASGHPFFIKSEQGNSNANAYNDGVTNNGAESATITFVVPMDAPDTLFYNCQFHSSMTGALNIID